MASQVILDARREYVAKHIYAVLGTAKDDLRPKEEVFEAAYESAVQNGLLDERYFNLPRTEPQRRARFLRACWQWWGGDHGIRSHYLPELGCKVAYGPSGIGRANVKRAVATSHFHRTTLRGSIAVENVETEAANTLLDAELQKVQVRYLLP